MTKTEQYGYVEGGKLHILNRRRMNEDLRQFKNVDVVIIIKKRGKRSLPQNAYYWGVVVKEIQLRFRELGTDADMDDIHEALKTKFNYERLVTADGEVIDIPKTTTELNKDEFGSYIDRIIEWAATSLEISIPAPNTQTELWTV